MKRIAIVVLMLFCAAFAVAQDTTTVSHFSVNASATGFAGAGSTSPATIAGATVALTNRVAAGYEQVIVPSVSATYYLGTAGYTMPLASLLGKSLNSHLVFDSSKWSTTFFAGAGVMRQDLTGTMQQNFASTVGASANYMAGDHVTLQIVSFQWLHANVVGPGRDIFVVSPDATTIATGLKLNF